MDLTDLIIILILLAMVTAAARYIYKAKKSGAKCIGCPAGGNCANRPLPVKQLDGRKLGEKAVSIEGMTCAHCVQIVTLAINKIEGASAKVDLKKKRAVVSYDRPVSDDAIKAAVEAKGFHVSAIR